MIELPGWNDFIFVNGFCYSSSMGESPKLNIPLKTSVAPTKGIAPATFARNSTATYIEGGLVKTAGINVPRFQNGRYLCEIGATNMLSYSELLTNSYWLKTNLSVVEDIMKGSFKLTNTTSGTCYIGSTNIYFNNGVYCTQSAILEKGNTNFACMAYASAFSPTLLPYAIFDLNSGTISYTKDCVATITPLSDNQFRCSTTAISTSLLNGTFCVITPSRAGASRVTGIIGDYIYATKSQVETGTKATSYIPTTTVPMDRVADVLHYTVGDVITQGQGSLYCEFWGGNYAGTTRRLLNISDGTNSNRIYPYIKDTGGVAVIGVTAGSAVINIGTVTVLSTLNKLLLSYENNSVKLYLNGILIGSDTSCTIPTNFTTLSIGCSHDGILQLNSEIGNVKYFKEVLTGAEAIKLTTL